MNPADQSDQPFAYALGGQPCTREAFYAIACDPQRNVVVQACAGAGKTWMLVSRILRALLDEAVHSDGQQPIQPHNILAITFTKKAAGEMRERLHQWLTEFAHADEAKLVQELQSRGIKCQIGQKSTDLMLKQLSNLYQTLLDSNRSVQIRTFHSWFGALLRSAPLAVLEQLNLPAQYELLEDDSQAVALVWRRFYAALHADAALCTTYNAAVAEHGRSNIDKALGSALSKRVEFVLAEAAGTVQNSIRHFAQVYTEFAGLDAPLEMLSTNRDHRQKLRDAAIVLGRAPQPSYSAKGVELETALTASNFMAAMGALLTKENEPRKFSEKITGIDQVRIAQDLCMRINAAQLQHSAWQHQQRLAQLSGALIGCFNQLKRERAWVDMGDIERAALHLLSDPVLSGWVLERLDAQTRHLLIDEFQDTNPLQWQALQAWLSGYAGAGGGSGKGGGSGTGGTAPSVFIVGDPKQSIYRFRRAEPQVFIAATDFVCDALGGVVLSCDHTRRNARGVLAVVNGVMQTAATDGYEGYRPHTTESTVAGQVLRLPLVQRDATDTEDDEADPPWRDTLTTPRDEAEEHIRTRECTQAAQWVAQHIAHTLTSEGQPLPAGSVMVLSRKRDNLKRMSLALQQLGIASQISEKTQLMDHCEVQDIVALVDALTSPTHDLAMARALKSPLFNCTDAQLSSIAQAARAQHCSWSQLLLNSELLEQQILGLQGDLIGKKPSAVPHGLPADLCSRLQQYQQWFATLPPHDALAALYQHADVVARFMAAAPAAQRGAVQTHVQALLAASLDVDGGRFLTPYAWVRALKAGHVRAPVASAKSANAVQLLTVHGAKGLEAHTVLLLDANAQAEKSRSMDVLIDWPAQHAAPTTFAFLVKETTPPRCVVIALLHEQAARAREETNALYVAMTRAQHTLALSAHDVRTTAAHSPWQRFAALPDGAVQDVQIEAAGAQQSAFAAVATNLSAAAPITPTSVSTDVFYVSNMPVVQVSTAQAAIKIIVSAAADSPAARQGQAMHRLLELYAPGLDLSPLARSIGAQFYLTAEQSDAACAMAQRITQGPAAWVWDAQHIDWQANEVELLHANQLLRLDRLVKHSATQTWWVLDYKSANAPQHQTALRAQLAQYQQAVQQAHPGAAVKAAFITGEGQLVELTTPA
jgi:ATP-dependent helicase/nuclease subunit A